jgi:hypothetical protein
MLVEKACVIFDGQSFLTFLPFQDALSLVFRQKNGRKKRSLGKSIGLEEMFEKRRLPRSTNAFND